MPKKTFYQELDDVIFIPKKKPLLKILLVLIFICLVGVIAIVFILNLNDTEDATLLKTQIQKETLDDDFKTVESFSNDWCKGV